MIPLHDFLNFAEENVELRCASWASISKKFCTAWMPYAEKKQAWMDVRPDGEVLRILSITLWNNHVAVIFLGLLGNQLIRTHLAFLNSSTFASASLNYPRYLNLMR